jgi:hypothetical protein
VTPTIIEPNARIVIEWPGHHGPTTVEWTFAPQSVSNLVIVPRADGQRGDIRSAMRG